MQTLTVIDTVHTYTGMRKVSLNRTSPTSPLRIFLNNNATLQLGLLDQVRGTACPAARQKCIRAIQVQLYVQPCGNDINLDESVNCRIRGTPLTAPHCLCAELECSASWCMKYASSRP